MLLADALAKRLEEDMALGDVKVRAFAGDDAADEQITVAPMQGFPMEGGAPVFMAYFEFRIRAPSYGRADFLCRRAYERLRFFVPDRQITDYVHAPPQVSVPPGYVMDDNAGRPMYGFTLAYQVTPKDIK